MPPFDAQTWLAVHEVPTYIDKTGARHTGRLWSHLEYVKWAKVFDSWLQPHDPPLSDQEYEAELRRLLASLGFPAKVADEMLALPSAALEQMVEGFFVLQMVGRDAPPSTPAPPPPSPPTIEPVSAPSAS